MSKEIKASDRRPWPTAGDTDENTLYASVGRALTAWERYEAQLAFLFAQFTTAILFQPSIRAYCAVRTFEGRADMLRAASKSYFYGFGIGKDHQLTKDYKAILSKATSFVPRRNDIAHGVVDHYMQQEKAESFNKNEFALFPAYGSLKERDSAGIPGYCYTSAELDYFSDQFAMLHKPAHILAAQISVFTSSALHTPVSALPRKSLPHADT
jgi:hypothetical protein